MYLNLFFGFSSWLSKWAAKVMAGLGQQFISTETQGRQHAEQAHAGLLLQKLLDDAKIQRHRLVVLRHLFRLGMETLMHRNTDLVE